MMLTGTPSRRDILDSKRVVPDRLQIASDRYFRGFEIAFIILRYQVVHEGQLRRLYGLVEDEFRTQARVGQDFPLHYNLKYDRREISDRGRDVLDRRRRMHRLWGE